MDSTGNSVWEKRLLVLPSNFVSAYSKISTLLSTTDGMRFTIAGELFDTSVNERRSCILQIDTDGNLLWFRSLEKPHLSVNEIDIVASPGGGFYFVSSISLDPPVVPPGNEPSTSWIYYGKLTEQGDTVWTRKVNMKIDSSYTYYGRKIVMTDDYHLLVMSTLGNEYRPVLFKADTFGNLVWYHEYYRINHFHPLQYWSALVQQGSIRWLQEV